MDQMSCITSARNAAKMKDYGMQQNQYPTVKCGKSNLNNNRNLE